MDVLLGIDQGTTGTTALLMDGNLKVLATCTKRVVSNHPEPAFVEQDPAQVWSSVQQAIVECLEKAKVRPHQIISMGITNQRETTCLFESSGQTVHPFVAWQCKRSAGICDRFKQADIEPWVKSKTGLVIDPYFSATKLMWLFEKYPEWQIKAQKGQLLFGTVDTWLLHQMTAGQVHATDATNASRTLLYNLNAGDFDPELLELFKVPKACLPHIGNSSQIYGKTKGLSFLPDGIPIGALVGDQQGALFGQACVSHGQAKATFGTGSFVLMHTGDQAVFSKHGLLSSVALRLFGKDSFCLEGSAFVAGDAIRWLIEGLSWFENPTEVQDWALKVPSSQDVVFVPALNGLGAPHWQPKAQGLLCGLSGETTKAHVARAVLEGIAFQNWDMLQAMEKDAGPLQSLKVDGGVSQSDLLLQFQADILNLPCLRPKNVEATALGAALLAGLSAGVFKDMNSIAAKWQIEREFVPKISDLERKNHIMKWQKALNRLEIT